MKALRFDRSLARFAAARVTGTFAPGSGARSGPLSLVDIAEPDLPGPGWHRVRPRLAGICGSDLATVDGRASRYFEPIVSFPFVPGHEVVGDLDDGRRVVIEPVLSCAARGIEPLCEWCAAGDTGRCQHLAHGHLEPGLQTGYCTDTGGGWSTSFVAHDSQIHTVADDLSDEAAVMVEPTACAIHAVLRAAVAPGELVTVLGAGTLGLLVVAAVRALAEPSAVIAGAKHPEQRAAAGRLGADLVVEPGELARAVRRASRSQIVGDRLSSGAAVTLDCVASATSITEAMSITRPGGRVILVGMPGPERLDLAPLWHRETALLGAYAYGVEHVGGRRVRTFELAFDLAHDADLGKLVSALYPLERYRDAIEHAASAGRRGATKVAFDLRGEKR